MAIISINGVGITPDPSSLKIDLQDIDASTTTRNAKGKMLRDRVCGGANAKRKLECEWSGISLTAASSISQAIKDEFFNVTYPDLYTGSNRTARFYAGDRSAPVYHAYTDADGNVTDIILENYKVNFIEE